MKRNVLIVDDEAAFRGFMAEVLDNAGYGAISASDCTEALASARNGGVDGIITGMVMPDMSGAELITRLRTGGSDAPIIAMTGLRKAMRIWAALAQNSMADFVLYKPFKAQEIRQAVQQLIKKNRMMVMAL